MSLRRLIPSPVKRRGRALQRHLIYLQVSVRALRRRPALSCALAELRALGEEPPSPALLSRLEYGWGNEKYGASPRFLAAIVKEAREADGSILECGSGLSTLVLGIEAAKRGTRVYSLEQDARWARRVGRELVRHDVDSADILFAPLRRYDDFVWYGVSPSELPASFALVVCDGPSQEEGSRYGLLPALRGHLDASTVILLDDAARRDVRGTLARWADEFDAAWRLEGGEKPFASVRLA